MASAPPTVNEFRCYYNCQPCNGLLLFSFRNIKTITYLSVCLTPNKQLPSLFQFYIFTLCFINMHNFYQYIFIQNTLINQMVMILDSFCYLKHFRCGRQRSISFVYHKHERGCRQPSSPAL